MTESVAKNEEEFEVSSLEEQAQQHSHNQEEAFVWDQNSQLYYHARSGFYHNPNEGWYYNTQDGFYYKFEDGNYVLFDYYNQVKDYHSEFEGQSESQLQAFGEHEYDQINQETEDVAPLIGECTSSELHGNPPPSEWLEDTLIELYLSGYQNTASNAAEYQQLPEETNEKDGSVSATDGNNKIYDEGDDELSMEHHTATDSNASLSNELNEEASWEEESWRAQYGQVVQPQDNLGTKFHILDLWDWSMVREIQKEGSFPVARLVGRLVQPSSKLHPSMPSHGRRLRTAPICKAHLDLVQGKCISWRTPSAKYLATLSNYDASNPTSDWGFPELSIDGTDKTLELKTAPKALKEYTSFCRDSPSVCEKKTNEYRDRAAERRVLHGSYGTAPGQKRSADDASPPPTEEAAAEALEMSLGAGSYAQKILKNMGWKEGEGLGKTQHGLKEPLKGIGNKGTAGLGWKSR